LTECPGSTEAGCRCVEHDPGLAAYSRDPVAYEQMLAKARAKTTLRVVTMGPQDKKPCDGSMTCDCEKCVGDRVARVKGKRKAVNARQPWQPRRARQAA
jgi:hypothetical protein